MWQHMLRLLRIHREKRFLTFIKDLILFGLYIILDIISEHLIQIHNRENMENLRQKIMN